MIGMIVRCIRAAAICVAVFVVYCAAAVANSHPSCGPPLLHKTPTRKVQEGDACHDKVHNEHGHIGCMNACSCFD